MSGSESRPENINSIDAIFFTITYKKKGGKGEEKNEAGEGAWEKATSNQSTASTEEEERALM